MAAFAGVRTECIAVVSSANPATLSLPVEWLPVGMLVRVHAAQSIDLGHFVGALHTNHMLNCCLPDGLLDGYLAFSASRSFHRSCFMYISESCSATASVR